MFENLVVVTSFQHHVKNCLVEFVLDEKVCVKESLENLKKTHKCETATLKDMLHLHNLVIASCCSQKHWRR